MFSKALSPILRRPLGREILVKPLPLNAAFPIDTKLSGKLIAVKEWPSKAFISISFKEFGKVIDVKGSFICILLENASPPIALTVYVLDK